jgi:ribose transport system permease protein
LSYLTFGLHESPDAIIVGSSRDVGIGGRHDLDSLRILADGKLYGIPMMFLLMLGIAAMAAVLLHWSVYGRYLYAVGYNEQAARYAGIATNRYKILPYVLCSLLAALGGILSLLDLDSAQPSSTGSLYELYAITGAVLGGCSLRGGQGTVVGILLGTAVLPLLSNLCIFANIPSDMEYTVIGLALLLGTIADELLKRHGGK